MDAACRQAFVRRSACNNVKPMLREKCKDALALSSEHAVEVRESVSFQEEHYVSLTIDGLPVVVPLSATSDVNEVSGGFVVRTSWTRRSAVSSGRRSRRRGQWTRGCRRASGPRKRGRRRGNLMLLWFSFASMASSWTSSPDDGRLYAPARVKFPREPLEGA